MTFKLQPVMLCSAWTGVDVKYMLQWIRLSAWTGLDPLQIVKMSCGRRLLLVH